MSLLPFVKILWPAKIEGALVLTALPLGKSYHLPLHDIDKFDADDERELAAINKTNCLYFGLGLRRLGLPPAARGGKNDVIALPGIALDVDVESGAAHKSNKLPKTDADVEAILSGSPTPSMVIATGHGYHFYWLFREPWRLSTTTERVAAGAAIKRFQQVFIDRAAGLGFHVDLTVSIDRIWRVSGHMNRKDPANPVPVTLVEHSPAIRYKLVELFGSFCTPTAPPTSTTAPPTSAPRPLINLAGLKKRLAKLSDPKIQKVLAGESFAERGGRDAAMQSVVSTIVWAAHGHGEPEELAKILKKSLKVWAEESGAELTLDDELAKAEEKFERAQFDFDSKEGAATAERDDYIKMLGRRLIGESFDEEEDPAPEQCLIIQHKRSYYVYDTESDQYYGSFIKDELLTVARDYFKVGKIPTTYVNADGIEKPMTLPMMLDKYCTVVRNLEGSLSLRKGRLDASQSLFVHAVAPVRKLEPRFDPQIDEWLRSFSRDPRLVEGVLDWVAGVSQLDAQCSALVLIGPPDTGKTTLAHGLSRLWHINGPTEWSNAVGTNFNESIIHCPLIELSEGFGNNQKWNMGQSNEFRKVVGSQSVQINPKGLTPYWIKGTVRIIIGSNDDTVLTDLVGGREVSVDSIEAIAKRLFVVNVSKRPKLLIDGWKEQDFHTVDRWIEDDYLARHSLWLAEDRVRLKSLRFLVEGDVASIHHRLTARRSDSESLLEWITGYMMSPGKFETAMKQAKREPVSSCGNGVLLLHGEEVNTTWKLYVNTDTGPLLGAPKVSRLLGNLRTNKRKLNRNGCRINVHQINPAVVFEFAKASMLGDRDVMTATLNRKLNGVVFEEIPDED